MLLIWVIVKTSTNSTSPAPLDLKLEVFGTLKQQNKSVIKKSPWFINYLIVNYL